MSDNEANTQQNNNSSPEDQNKKEIQASDEQQENSAKKDDEQRKKPTKKPKKQDRSNKIYRTPATPSPVQLLVMEKSFILDCNATSSISRDYSLTNPKLGPVIPPYNSQKDKHANNYFRFNGVKRTLKKTGQYNKEATSIEGSVADSFYKGGAGFRYLSLRNKCGAGHSQEIIDGHAQFMQGIVGVSGYNGLYGFRRNTPWLRKAPTAFGTPLIFPIS
jgi:hypothetical protein